MKKTVPQRDDLLQFYGEMVWDYLDQNPNEFDPNQIADALGITLSELALGLAWCEKLGIITIGSPSSTEILH